MTFGRIRTVHLTAVLYGWITNAALGVIIWLLPRLLRTHWWAPWVMLGGALINTGIASAIGAIGSGWTDGMEYLEIPWQIGLFIVAGFICIIGPVLYTLVNRKVESLYVTVWYHVAALLWIALLFIVAKLPGVHTGVQQATTNWWYGHNVLGLWFTPVSVGAIYYFLPKIIGRPVRSYNLSILGFWTLAFFYGQVGGHHLIGGPGAGLADHAVHRAKHDDDHPVVAFTINMAGTMWGRMHLARYSPTLRFMMFGGFMYMLSSLQGSLEALRSRQPGGALHALHRGPCPPGRLRLCHHGAVWRHLLHDAARAELGVAVSAPDHAAVLAGGHRHHGIYFVGLSIGGWLQGLAMLDAAKRPFMDSVAVTIPYLQWRSVGGSLMVLSHLIFVGHFLAMALRFGPHAPAPPCSGRARPGVRSMENEVKLAAGAIVALAVATTALVVLPYMQVRDIHAARRPQALHQRRAARARGLHRQWLRVLPHPAAARPQPGARCRARLGPGLGAGRLRVRQTPPAGQHAHRPGSVQHRRAPAQQDWHLGHLYQPRAYVPGSIMPSYPYMFEVKDRRRAGRRGAQAPARQAPDGTVVVARPEALDLVKYLQGLNHTYPVLPPQPQAAPPRPRPARRAAKAS
jgi:cytochrome c oxidase cbb3-type subunit 1